MLPPSVLPTWPDEGEITPLISRQINDNFLEVATPNQHLHPDLLLLDDSANFSGIDPSCESYSTSDPHAKEVEEQHENIPEIPEGPAVHIIHVQAPRVSTPEAQLALHENSFQTYQDDPDLDDDEDENLWYAAPWHIPEGANATFSEVEVQEEDQLAELVGGEEKTFKDDRAPPPWAELLDLELYEEDPDLASASSEEEHPAGDLQLDDFAAKLVNQFHVIGAHQRTALHRRLKAILEEFPYPASYRALARQINAGTSIETLEDACSLKCIWREANWLWSGRHFDRMQGAWVTVTSPNHRSALTWKSATDLIHRFGYAEAELNLLSEWLTDWQNLKLNGHRDARSDASIWSFAGYVQMHEERADYSDADLWFLEDPLDRQLATELRLYDGEREVWRFAPPDELTRFL